MARTRACTTGDGEVASHRVQIDGDQVADLCCTHATELRRQLFHVPPEPRHRDDGQDTAPPTVPDYAGAGTAG